MALGYRSRLIVARYGAQAVAPVAPLNAPAVERHDLPRQVLRTARSKPLAWLAASLAITACGYLGHAGYILAKAQLAHALIERAWTETRATGKPVPPWPWADVHPVARVSVPRLGAAKIVLEGDTGRSLAFAPGHRIGTPLPGADGNAVISAHRDTHFTFLRHVRTGDRIVVETATGSTRAYRVTGTEVAHKDRMDLLADRHRAELTLVTCWPFDAVEANGPLRYVVKAVAEGANVGPANARGSSSAPGGARSVAI